MTSGPLAGVLVVEVCGWHTGPASATILADQGADVIKIEAGRGDDYRQGGTSRGGFSAAFMAANRNKRSITLDLKSAGGVAALKTILARADVLLQNQRPGVMERLGLGPEQLLEEFPRLIYASISGYGRTGPKAHERSFDTMIQAMSGMAAVNATADGRPRAVPTLVPDKVTSPMVAQAICAALFQRERTGKGSVIDYSMLDAMVWFMWPDGMANHSFIGDGVRIGAPMSDLDLISKTADGYMVVAPNLESAWRAFIEVVERPELRDDERFSTPTNRMMNIRDFSAEIRNSLGGKTNAEWEALFSAADIPCAVVLDVGEVADHPQMRWNDLIEVVDHPAAGKYRAPRAPVYFDGHRNGTYRHVPAVGADTEAVFAEFGIEIDDSETSVKKKA